MLNSQIVLNGSNDHANHLESCHRCGKERIPTDGVTMKKKFFCGSCWRLYSTRGAAGIQQLLRSTK